MISHFFVVPQKFLWRPSFWGTTKKWENQNLCQFFLYVRNENGKG